MVKEAWFLEVGGGMLRGEILSQGISRDVMASGGNGIVFADQCLGRIVIGKHDLLLRGRRGVEARSAAILTWSSYPGATGRNIYRGTSTGAGTGYLGTAASPYTAAGGTRTHRGHSRSAAFN